MYLDRNDISFRKEDVNDLLKKDKLVVFRPGNRKYPENRGYIPGEVVKARIIDIPGSDDNNISPRFSSIVQLVKIMTIELLKLDDLEKINFKYSLKGIKSKEDLKMYLNKIYGKGDYKLLTKIYIEKVNNDNLVDNSYEIRELFSSGVMKFALLPKNNVTDLDELLNAYHFSITFINHDYAGMTPFMWNHISNLYNLGIKNSMVIIKPEDFEKSLNILSKNNKYIGGGLGVGFKDLGWKILSQKDYGFINPFAEEMQSINFIAHYGKEIHGFNSDASGYVDSLGDKLKETGSSLEGKNIIILGAGGTARGIALELVNRGVGNIIIINRTEEKAQYIANKLNKIKQNIASAGDENQIFKVSDKKIDVIINLSTKGADGEFSLYSAITPTNLGLDKNLSESKKLLIKLKNNNPNLIISDINLTQSKATPLLDEAKKLGLNTLDGKLMVIYQGVQAIWTIFGDKIIKAGGTKEKLQEELLEFVNNLNKM